MENERVSLASMAERVNLTDVAEGGDGGLLSFEPSLPTCIGLSALGGLLEVTSTMCLAFPEYKAKLGRPYGKCTQRVLLAVNLALMGVASVLYVVGSWFGPVSISVPTVMVSKLLSNLVIMGLVLRMADFTKAQQVGTRRAP
jgi:hypothetical protein